MFHLTHAVGRIFPDATILGTDVSFVAVGQTVMDAQVGTQPGFLRVERPDRLWILTANELRILRRTTAPDSGSLIQALASMKWPLSGLVVFDTVDALVQALDTLSNQLPRGGSDRLLVVAGRNLFVAYDDSRPGQNMIIDPVRGISIAAEPGHGSGATDLLSTRFVLGLHGLERVPRVELAITFSFGSVRPVGHLVAQLLTEVLLRDGGLRRVVSFAEEAGVTLTTVWSLSRAEWVFTVDGEPETVARALPLLIEAFRDLRVTSEQVEQAISGVLDADADESRSFARLSPPRTYEVGGKAAWLGESALLGIPLGSQRESALKRLSPKVIAHALDRAKSTWTATARLSGDWGTGHLVDVLKVLRPKRLPRSSHSVSTQELPKSFVVRTPVRRNGIAMFHDLGSLNVLDRAACRVFSIAYQHQLQRHMRDTRGLIYVAGTRCIDAPGRFAVAAFTDSSHPPNDLRPAMHEALEQALASDDHLEAVVRNLIRGETRTVQGIFETARRCFARSATFEVVVQGDEHQS